jgi:hypothetical protein
MPGPRDCTGSGGTWPQHASRDDLDYGKCPCVDPEATSPAPSVEPRHQATLGATTWGAHGETPCGCARQACR